MIPSIAASAVGAGAAVTTAKAEARIVRALRNFTFTWELCVMLVRDGRLVDEWDV